MSYVNENISNMKKLNRKCSGYKINNIIIIMKNIE